MSVEKDILGPKFAKGDSVRLYGGTEVYRVGTVLNRKEGYYYRLSNNASKALIEVSEGFLELAEPRPLEWRVARLEEARRQAALDAKADTEQRHKESLIEVRAKKIVMGNWIEVLGELRRVSRVNKRVVDGRIEFRLDGGGYLRIRPRAWVLVDDGWTRDFNSGYANGL